MTTIKDIKTMVARMLPKTKPPVKTQGIGIAPVNIALIKYWGKRCQALNLPVTDSLSITLPECLSKTKIKPSLSADLYYLHGEKLQETSTFYKRMSVFLDLFRTQDVPFFEVHTENTVPTAAGLASSASGFAALVLALNDLFGWHLSDKRLSILARLGSGSACRSLWNGFVHWHAGIEAHGLDSFATPITTTWPNLMMGIIMINEQQKPISSRQAMQQTVATSPLYQAWPATVTQHLATLLTAIDTQDFTLLGQTAEHNAECMHASMQASWPSISYRLPQTLSIIETVKTLRQEGLAVYFTQDAGPNIKLLFEHKDLSTLQTYFPKMQAWSLFTTSRVFSAVA